MFRQDRTNPSTAISNWRGRLDTLKGWPSSAVSTWLNGGLFGAAGITAFGGIITQYEDSGTTYRVHTFRGSGKFFVSAGAADVDYLIVAGGGGAWQGGGGAGGMLTDTGVAVSAGTYTIVVGTGGTFGNDSPVNGGNSSALGITATGGGNDRRAADTTSVSADGGSGGGGSYTSSYQTKGDASPAGQGNDGGDGVSGGMAGGGGGAGEAGNTDGAGYGGDGATGYGITATTPYYAGGGGAVGSGETTGGLGGDGGGGDNVSGTGTGGTPNTGGGAAGNSSTANTAGAGIVIIRYEVAA